MTLPNIGLIGRKQSGKDTSGDYLAEFYGYNKSAFADPLRAIARRVNSVVDAHPLTVRPYAAGPGEMPVHLAPTPGVRILRYADAEARYGYEAAKAAYPEFRRTLQETGVAYRDIVGPNVWVDAWFASVRPLLAERAPIVVTDVRFPNEADYLRELGFTLVRVMRPATHESGDLHVSETALDYYAADVRIVNDGPLGDLYEALDDAVTRR